MTSCWVVIAPINDVLAIFANALEIGNAGKIDKMRRACEPQLHHRNKTVPARDCARVVAETAEQADGFLNRRWPMIGE